MDRRKGFLLVWLLVACLAAAFADKLPLTISGGTLAIQAGSINSGGGSSSGGSVLHNYTVGQPNTTMSGGTFTLKPGALAAANMATSFLDNAHAFPTPFKPSLGHDRITFSQLPTIATINIYTISGERVIGLTKNDGSTDKLIWYPVTNLQGSSLASGLYIFVISSPGLTPKKGKLMIIK